MTTLPIYSVVFTMRDGGIAAVDQCALNMRDAVARVHVAYAHLNRTATYSVARGRCAMTVSAARDGGIAQRTARHWRMRARRRANLVIAGYAVGAL